jgi:hypothetical protein
MVRDQIEALQAEIEAIRELPRTEADRVRRDLRLKVIEITRESIRRDDEIHELIAAQTRAAITERRREGVLFAGGILLALVGSVLTSAC